MHAFKPLHFLDAVEDGNPVGEGAGQPTLGHVGHTAAGGLFLDGLLRLALCANKKDRAAVGYGLGNHLIGLGEGFNRLLQVDDMNAVALGENERAHGRVPFVGAMPEVNTTFQQSFHGNN